MHRLTDRQKEIAVRTIKYLRALPEDKKPRQREISSFVGISQSQLSRHLSVLTHIRFLEKRAGALAEGPQAEKYLADWAVYLLGAPHTRPAKGRGGAA